MQTPARLLGRVAAAFALLYAVLLALGLLISRVLADLPPLSSEDAVTRALQAGRSPGWTAVSGFFSVVGSTGTIVGVTAVVAAVFRLAFGRWRESAFLVLAVAAQTLIFLLVTLVVRRDRPYVTHLDPSPPTSSFPSGHTGASTALYVGIAVVLAWRTRSVWARRSVVVLLVSVPLSVALSRLYRGMHHPSDVLAAMANGGACVLVSARALLFRALPPGLARLLDGARPDSDRVRSGASAPRRSRRRRRR